MKDILEIIKSIRTSDCGGWLTDCGGAHFRTCADGREKRQELSHLLEQLYKAAEAMAQPVDDNQTDRLDLLTQRIVLMEAQGADLIEDLGEAQKTIHYLENRLDFGHQGLTARVTVLERQIKSLVDSGRRK